jgi:hypothetical protein
MCEVVSENPGRTPPSLSFSTNSLFGNIYYTISYNHSYSHHLWCLVNACLGRLIFVCLNPPFTVRGALILV